MYVVFFTAVLGKKLIQVMQEKQLYTQVSD